MSKAASQGGKHWKEQEVNLLLDQILEILPCGGNEWESVSVLYNSNRLAWMSDRDGESCKTKFKSLKNVKKPTGDPTCPPNVKRAKRIQYQIESKISVATMDDIANDHNDSEADNEGFFVR
jgi:hypothetical protein